MKLYDDIPYECESALCELALEITNEWIFYGLLIAAILKLIRADKIANKFFIFALIGPLFGVFLLIPISIVYSSLSYFNLSIFNRWLISALVVAILVLCFLIIKYEIRRNSYSEARRSFTTPWWRLKKHFVSYFNVYYPWSWYNKLKRQSEDQRSNEKKIIEIGQVIDKEIKNRFNYQSLFVFFSIFIYWWLEEFIQMNYPHSFINYEISLFVKYPILLFFLASATYVYTKYYNFFAHSYFYKMISILKILENEQKFLYLKDPKPLQLSVLPQIPRAITEPTKYGKFDLIDDQGIYLYWVSSDMKYSEYEKTNKVLNLYGIENYLDLRNKNNNLSNQSQ